MSIFDELRATEQYTRDAERRSFKTTQTAKRFDAPPLSRIRERALALELKAVASQNASSWQDAPKPTAFALSHELDPLQGQRLALRRGAEMRLRQQIDEVRRQDASADADAKAFARLSPLQQAKKRDGWYRVSELDRMAAVAGLLRRERRNLSPLTREATSRAKSIDAARRLVDPYVVTTADLQNREDNRDLLDPCVEYRLIAQRRRETFFAKGLVISGGYPGARGHSKSPC